MFLNIKRILINFPFSFPGWLPTLKITTDNPLHSAAQEGETEYAKYLLELGADINCLHKEGGKLKQHYYTLLL